MVALTSEGKERLDALIATIAGEGKIPGFVVGATTADEEIYLNAGGKNVVGDETSGDVDPESVFWMCSSTKFITHVSALQLIERGKLDLESPVSDILPQLQNPVLVEDTASYTPEVISPAKTVLRVKHLLNFSAGTFYIQTLDGGFAMNKVYTNEYTTQDKHAEFFEILKGQLPGVPLRYEPGSSFIYGLNSDILGFVVERVTGQTLDQYMQDNIFKPLGMHASFYFTGDLKEKMLPIGLRRPADGLLEPYTNQPEVKIVAKDPSKVVCLGGVGLYTSIKSYLALLRHVLQILEGKATNPIISLDTAKSLFVPQLTEEGTKNVTALGHMLGLPGSVSWSNAFAVTAEDWKGRRKAGSGTWGGWLGTMYWIDPATGIAGMVGTQLLCVTSGAADPEFLKVGARFEEALYSSLI